MSPFLEPVLEAWFRRVLDQGPWRALVWVVVAAVFFAMRKSALPLAAQRGLLLLVTAGAVGAAAARASVVDDAFIALRYAQNLLAGHGLVFNLGERVEGYTDLLWVLLVALGTWVSGVELPLVALIFNLVIVAANVALVAATARRIFGGGFPLAAVLLAGHGVFLNHGTTGLETGLLALLVQLALYALAGAPSRRSAFLSGVALVLAVLTRPDAALFLPVAAAAVWIRAQRTERLRHLLALSAPGLLLVGVEIWRLAYYGDWLPNTAYTKSAGGAYWSQGFVYLTEFWLGSASLPWAIIASIWALRGRAPAYARVFVGLIAALQIVYVGRIGGDFMSGRFFVVLLPLLALSAEGAWRDLGVRRPVIAAALAGLLVAGLNSGSLQRPTYVRWYIADEGSLYRVKTWWPVTIDHASYDIGTSLAATLTDRGIRPTIALGTIGMVGYYSRLPLIDLHGLTDRTVARSDSGKRGHIGHEKMASERYLRRRGVTLLQSERLCGDETYRALRGVIPPTGPNPKKPWCFLQWDPELASDLRARAPEWRLPNPGAWIDAYIASLPNQTSEDASTTLAFLDTWSFERTPDPDRRDPIAARAAGP
jgi:hypothetical protein